MILEIRKISTTKDSGLKFNFAVIGSFLIEFFIIVLGFKLIGFFPDFEVNKLIGTGIFIAAFGFPIIIMLSLFIVLKLLRLNNPYVLSLLITTIATIALLVISLIQGSNLDMWTIAGDFLGTFGMIFFWIILIQTQKNKARAISVGIFLFFVISRGVNFIKLIVVSRDFDFSYFFSILLFAILAMIFEFILVSISKLIALRIKD